MKHLLSSLFAAIFSGFLCSMLSAQPIGILNDVPFAEVGGRPLLMDLYFPTNGDAGPWPVVIYIHGGGWTSGSHNPPYPNYIQGLPANGVMVASIQYRLTSEEGQWGTESVHFPAQIHDVKGAVRFLRAHSEEYHLDPFRIATWGPSAGGHLAALLGTSGGVPELEGNVGGNLDYSSRVQLVMDYYGLSDILNMNLDVTVPPGSSINHDGIGSGESALLGFNNPGEGIGVLRANQNNPNPPYPELITLATQANPITWVDPTDPPFFIAHEENDVVVPTHQSQRLANALEEAGVLYEFHRVPGMGHATPPAEINTQALEFLKNQLAPDALPINTVTVDGVERRFLLSVPTTPPPTNGWSLILMNHGGGGSPEEFANATEMHLLGQQEGFITVYTASRFSGWTVGNGADSTGLAELPYFHSVLEAVQSSHPVNPERLFIAGHSNGGVMAHIVIHNIPETFAGAAIVNSGIESSMLENPLSHPLHVALFRGTNDPIVPFQGGTQAGPEREVLSAEAMITYYANTLMVPSVPSSELLLPDLKPGDQTTTTRREFSPGQLNVSMRTYISLGGGHPWPGNENSMLSTGPIVLDFEASTEIWSFFSDKTLPPSELSTIDSWSIY